MARKTKPIAEAIAIAQAAEVVAVAAQAAAPAPEAPPDVFDQAIARREASDTRKPDPSGRYPGREHLPPGDLLHTFEPTPERGVLGFHINGGHRCDGGASVQLIDDRAGLGIRFQPGRPSDGVLAAVKEDKAYKDKPVPTPKWDARVREWRKRPGDNPVGTRIDMEERTASAGERLREERANAGTQSRG